MRHGGTVALGLAGGLILQISVFALTPDAGNPYAPIVDRNVFALRPPPPPKSEEPPVAPPQKITLQGIVSAFGKKQVMFKTMMPGTKPGEAPKETSFMLSEGERAGEIEILGINETAGAIKVKNNGIEQSLTLEKDGMKPQGGPGVVPGVVPGLPGVPGAPGAVPHAVPMTGVPVTGGVPAPAAGSTVTTFGNAASTQRPLRVTPATPTTASGYNGVYNAAPQIAGQTLTETKPTISALEQIALLEVNRRLSEDKVKRGEIPPLPPPPLP